MPIKKFRQGILEEVRVLGGQFACAHMTDVPGGETLESQRNDRVILFRTDWHWKPEEAKRLTVGPSIPSQVIYLENLVEGSLDCTCDKVDARKTVEEILASLPKVEGLKWMVGNTPTVNRVLVNHLKLKETGNHLLPSLYTWTTDTYESREYGLARLLAGSFDSFGVDVDGLGPGESRGHVGLFVLGVPE